MSENLSTMSQIGQKQLDHDDDAFAKQTPDYDRIAYSDNQIEVPKKKSISVSNNDDTSLRLTITPSSSSVNFESTNSTPSPRPESASQNALQEALKSEKEFIEYVMSFPTNNSIVSSGGSNNKYSTRDVESGVITQSGGGSTPKVGLDHLDNLCKLMQQLGDLKEANSNLNRKVLYLEDMKTLHEMHQEMKQSLSSSVTPEIDFELSSKKLLNTLSSSKSAHFVHYSPQIMTFNDNQNKCDARLLESKKERRNAVHKSKSQVLISGSKLRRERSKSVGHDDIVAADGNTRRKSKRGFPRWSRVKEALGWEKGTHDHATDTDCSNKKRGQIRGSSRDRSFTKRDVKYLKVSAPHEYNKDIHRYICYDASDNEEFDNSESASCTGTGHISADEILIDDSKGQSNKRRSLGTSGGKSSVADVSENYRRSSTPLTTKTGSVEDTDLIKQKSQNKGPWTRVKTMIQTRKDSIKKKSRKSTAQINHNKTLVNVKGSIETDPVNSVTIEVLLSGEGASGIANSFREAKSLSDISTNTINTNELIDSPYSDVETKSNRIGNISPRALKLYDTPKSSPIMLTPPERVQTKDGYRRNIKNKPKPLVITPPEDVKIGHRFIRSKSRTISEASMRTPSLSPPVQRKSRWNKMKKVFATVEPKPLYDPNDDLSISRSVPASPASTEVSFNYDELLDPSASSDDKLQEFDKPKKETQKRMKRTDSRNNAPSTASPVEELVLELQRNVSEDFTKKMQEWERIRGYGQKPMKLERKSSLSKLTTKKRKVERTTSEGKSPRTKVKDLNWLDKELQKIERERQRLAKEKQKYEERLLRLQKLKDSVINIHNANKKEVLIRTSAGEFRFEGISDDFTKKLYEWETKRGVGPELSTIALLDSSKNINQQMCSKSIDDSKSVTDKTFLQKGISKSEFSVSDTNGNNQQSQQTTSSTSLPSLKQKDSFRRLNQPLDSQSKSNSVPDLLIPINSNDELSKLKSTSGDITKKNSSKEVSQIDSTVTNHGINKKKFCSDYETSHDDNYYNLLEENMHLLEHLKTKEEICRRLESELESLDDRMVYMNITHKDEMERFREKLWEVHMGSTCKPKDLQQSLKLITELKNKIEELQHCSERLKCDKETLEDSFRYHSEQQAKLTVDLIEKMKDLQHMSSCTSAKDDGRRNRRRKGIRYNQENVTKLHELSTQLLQQARDLEHALIERTRQICRLRWELLTRDVSAMRLQTELQHAKVQQTSRTPQNAIEKRFLYKQRRSWSSSEAMCLKLLEKQNNNEESVQNRYNRISTMIYNNWPKLDLNTNELSNTVQHLKMEIVKLSTHFEQQSESDDVNSETELMQQSEKQNSIKYNGIHATPLLSELLPDYDYYVRENGNGESSQGRRNSVDNMSSMSGHGSEESSSLNDGERYVLRLPRGKRWRRSRDNVSTSSESSFIEEESFAAVSWCRPRTSSDFESEKNDHCSGDGDDHNDIPSELVLKYSNKRKNENKINRFNGKDYSLRASSSRSSSEITDQRTDSWGDIYKHKGFHYGQFSETSSSAFNEGLEESSSASGYRLPSIDTPDSTQSNFRSSSSSGHGNQYSAIPMIDADDSPSWKTRIENEVIPEGCALPAAERRHSDPDRRFKFSSRTIKAFENMDNEYQTSIFTVVLPRKCSVDSNVASSTIQEESLNENSTKSQNEEKESNLLNNKSDFIKSEDIKSELRSGETITNELSVNLKKITDMNQSDDCAIRTDASQSMSSLASLNSDASQKRLSAASDTSSPLETKSVSSNTNTNNSSTNKTSLTSKVSSHFSKLRKSKSKSEMSAVAALCKQSLMMNLEDNDKQSLSCDTETFPDNACQSSQISVKSGKSSSSGSSGTSGWLNVFKK